ncbi:hypothetical protein IW137_001944, partial [Coemansia sp. RSA 1287]
GGRKRVFPGRSGIRVKRSNFTSRCRGWRHIGELGRTRWRSGSFERSAARSAVEFST